MALDVCVLFPQVLVKPQVSPLEMNFQSSEASSLQSLTVSVRVVGSGEWLYEADRWEWEKRFLVRDFGGDGGVVGKGNVFH